MVSWVLVIDVLKYFQWSIFKSRTVLLSFKPVCHMFPIVSVNTVRSTGTGRIYRPSGLSYKMYQALRRMQDFIYPLACARFEVSVALTLRAYQVCMRCFNTLAPTALAQPIFSASSPFKYLAYTVHFWLIHFWLINIPFFFGLYIFGS
jgi:hypothetical protein